MQMNLLLKLILRESSQFRRVLCYLFDLRYQDLGRNCMDEQARTGKGTCIRYGMFYGNSPCVMRGHAVHREWPDDRKYCFIDLFVRNRSWQ